MLKMSSIITQEAVRKWFWEVQEFWLKEHPVLVLNGNETSQAMWAKVGKLLTFKRQNNTSKGKNGNKTKTITKIIENYVVLFPYIRKKKALRHSYGLNDDQNQDALEVIPVLNK